MNDEVKKVEAAALAFANREKSWVETHAKPLLIGAGVMMLLIVSYLFLR